MLQNVLDSLEAGREGLEIRSGADRLHPFQPAFEIHQVGPSGRHASAYFVVAETADFAEVVFGTVAQELAQCFVLTAEIDWDPGFHDDAHHALRGAPKRERILRSARDQADFEALA